jgi:hypothetical protein
MDVMSLDPRFAEVFAAIAQTVEQSDPSFQELVGAVVAAESAGNPGAWRPTDDTYGLLQLSPRRGPGIGIPARQLLRPDVQARVGLPVLADAYSSAAGQGMKGEQLVRAVCRAAGYLAEPVLRELKLGPFAPEQADQAPAPASAEATIQELKAELERYRQRLASVSAQP